MAKAEEFVTQKKIDNNMSNLHDDVRNLGENVKEYGQQKFEKMQRKATNLYHSAKENGQETYSDVKDRLHSMEGQINHYVREKPGTSLAIAAGVGFLAALLLRR